MRKLLTSVAVAAFIAVAGFTTLQAHAWGEAEYTGNGAPRFNTYTNVPDYGNESDFLRIGGVTQKGSTFTDTFNACEGEARIKAYIHNGAPETFNGTNNDGTGVAKDVKLSINVPKTSADKFEAVVSASNAPSVKDGTKLTCNGEEVQIEYVPGSADLFTLDRGVVKLSDSVVTPGGAAIGSMGDNGVVPGCWHFRNYVSIVVRVKKVVKPQVSYTCDGIKEILIGDRKDNKYKFVGRASATNATIKSYVFDFGDGKTQTVTTNAKEATSEEHTFTKNSTVKVTVNFDVDGQNKTATGQQCEMQIRLNDTPVPPKPPVTPPVTTVTTIPQTGAESALFGTFSLSALAYAVRRWLDSRRGL